MNAQYTNQIIIEAKITGDDDFAILCLMKLYEKQTADEQAAKQTNKTNRQGFNKTDSLVLSPIAEKVKNGEKLTPIELKLVRKLLPKYAKQLTTLLTQKEIIE
jgi:hypothetical protein